MGYRLAGDNMRSCEVDGNWSGAAPTCVALDCGNLTSLTDGSVNVSGINYNAVASYSCNLDYVLVGDQKRVCGATGDWSGLVPSCVSNKADVKTCPSVIDNRNMTWIVSMPNQIREMMCQSNFTGTVTRKCGFDGTWQAPQYNCERAAVTKINSIISTFTENTTDSDIRTVLQQMASATFQEENVTEDSKLTSKELDTLSASLLAVANLLSNSTMSYNVTDVLFVKEGTKHAENTRNTRQVEKKNMRKAMDTNILATASNLIDTSNTGNWKSLSGKGGASKVIEAIDSLGEKLAAKLLEDDNKTLIVKKNIALAVEKVQDAYVVFPDIRNNYMYQENWIKQTQSSIRLDTKALTATDTVTKFVTTAIMYRNISDIIPTDDDNKTRGTEKKINGPVLAFSIKPSVNHTLSPPIKIQFEHDEKNLTDPACVFWKFESNYSGHWSTDGCRVNMTNSTRTICTCDHLTNFALLMSPFQQADASSIPLRVVSIIGISISIVGLLITLVLHFYLWKYLRNDRTTLLINLCAALLISYLVFLAGIDRTESKVFCTIVAAFLHYIYLVVFCAMLAEGIAIAVTVLFVFATRSKAKTLAISAWVVPAVIVAITIGITKPENYRSDIFCWLSIDNGVAWAFVGPAVAVILINVIILCFVLRAMFTTARFKNKNTPEKVKTSVRSLCVLVPLMGVSWILGLFYINKDSYVMQFIFAVCNGLQGVFIFLFHCVLNKKLRKAWKSREERKQSLKTTLRSVLRSSTNEELETKTLYNENKKNRTYLNGAANNQDIENRDMQTPILHNAFTNEEVPISSHLRTFLPSPTKPTVAFNVDFLDSTRDDHMLSRTLNSYLFSEKL